MPNDIGDLEYSDPPRTHGAVYSSIGYSKPLIRPRDEDLKHAAEILNSGERVAILIGQGAIGAEDE